MKFIKQDTLSFYSKRAKNYIKFNQQPFQKFQHRKEKEKTLLWINKKDIVLDLGCGGGRSSIYLAEKAQRIVGLDGASGMVEIARIINKRENIKYILGDAENLPFKKDCFDKATAFGCLNNMENIGKVISEVIHILKRNGLFIATIENKNELFRPWRWFYLWPYFLYRVLPKFRLKRFSRLYSAEEIRKLLKDRFEILEISGFKGLLHFIPEAPFNIFKPLFPITTFLLNLLEPLEDCFCNNEKTKERATYLFVVAKLKNK